MKFYKKGQWKGCEAVFWGEEGRDCLEGDRVIPRPWNTTHLSLEITEIVAMLLGLSGRTRVGHKADESGYSPKDVKGCVIVEQ